jgi:Xaa-Pro aminopeptidase
MLSDDLIARLSRLATFSNDPAEVAPRLRRLVQTPSNRWRLDWVAELFPGMSEGDKAALLAAIGQWQPPLQHFLAERLVAVRDRLAKLAVDGFVVPQSDEHQGEFVPPRNQRLAWLTGFTGSAGMAVITPDKAWLFVDGRYIEQAKRQVDAATIEVRHFQKPPTWQFLAGALSPASRLGYDPALHSVAEIERVQNELAKARIELVAVDDNPIDALWSDRPTAAFSPLVAHPIALSGRSLLDKINDVAAELAAKQIDATVLNQLDSIAWLYNVRGGDVANTPVAECFAVAYADGHSDLFIEGEKITPAAREHLGNHVTVRRIVEFDDALRDLGRQRLTVGVDPARVTNRIRSRITAAGGTVQPLEDPTAAKRIRKNDVEIANIKEAMVRDGVCMARFLRWLQSRPADALPDELEIVAALEEFRAADPTYRGPSFPSIVGIGGNGAVVHYHPATKTNRRLEPGVLVLIDSGGQFLTGTTDITRTLVHSEPSAVHRTIYTTVLKGHIALACTRFPKGAVGGQLDAIARAALWRIGINYDHGTGHGIGAFLGVHEGPVRIAPGATLPLDTGMVMSNEPGAYLTEKFGIRLENSVLVVASGAGQAEDAYLEFETLSLAPFDRQLIDVALLTAPELKWLNAYHALVRQLVGAQLAGEDAAWLHRATTAY